MNEEVEELLNNPLFITYINKSNITSFRTIEQYAKGLNKYLKYKNLTIDKLPPLTVDELQHELDRYGEYLTEENPKKTFDKIRKEFTPIKQYYQLIHGVVFPKKASKRTRDPDSFKYTVFDDFCKGLKKQTRRHYGLCLDEYMKWTGNTLDEILKTTKNTDEILDELEVYKMELNKTIPSLRTCYDHVGCVRRFYKHFGLIKKNNDDIYPNSHELEKIEEIRQIRVERNIAPSTFQGYLTVLMDYCNFHKMTIQELLQEAQHDEETIHVKKNRTIKQRLLKYRSYLINNSKHHSSETIKGYIAKVQTFYNHYEIEIPNLPNVKLPSAYKSTYDDLPTKEQLRQACDLADQEFKALILFMSSSGTARAETLSLTVGDFIKGCKDYTTKTDIHEALQELRYRDDVVPTLYLRRIKTDKYYHTFCSPEASKCIIEVLIHRRNIQLGDSLFNITPGASEVRFQKINDEMRWGKVGRFRFFRSHVMRKYYASNIGLPPNIVDDLEGRSKSMVHEAYIKSNPEKLKQMYIEHMNNVMIYNEVPKPYTSCHVEQPVVTNKSSANNVTCTPGNVKPQREGIRDTDRIKITMFHHRDHRIMMIRDEPYYYN
ncbi:hypothetical protein [Methanosphaera cuniculi]|uniref:Uncharacterized protein n=1 Tax=Methanosphaera cuniculi TaxID=1077256 RepID=A0A2A2HDW0_9EURY|nr:hypothetical protein [Methanosphaera cuniculi]PAV07555.1 hypothetical protein ASJ82_07715 [Methanosphaera cuniculi]PWL08128.1 hypothetical protein MSCUN_10590 [Methanosphaera cuniculi]